MNRELLQQALQELEMECPRSSVVAALREALAAPAPAVPLTREQQIAIREAHCNTASDEYFGARPSIDNMQYQRAYEAGFKEGWEGGIGTTGGGNG